MEVIDRDKRALIGCLYWLNGAKPVEEARAISDWPSLFTRSK